MATKKKSTSQAESGTALSDTASTTHLGVPDGFTAEFQSSLEGYLDKTDATALVFSCTGVGAVDTGTTLGVLFPSDMRRSGFCGAVFNKAAAAGVRVSPASIPSSKTNTIEEVIDSLSC